MKQREKEQTFEKAETAGLLLYVAEKGEASKAIKRNENI